MDGVWTCLIFIKHEGGYRIILRSLLHYRKRLRTVGQSPELDGAAVFSQIIQQEAARTYPAVGDLIARIPQCLADAGQLRGLQDSLPLLRRALESYRSDLGRAADGVHDYYRGLVGTGVPDGEIRAVDEAIARMAYDGKDVNQRPDA